MTWTIEYADSAIKQLRKLGKPAAKRILDYMDQRIATADDARDHGKALTGPLGVLWRYRVGDYRVLCEIQDNRLLVLVVQVGHRRDVYR